jgi:hypothetical protein
MLNIFNESILFISKDKKTEADDFEEEKKKWAEIEEVHS